LFLFFFNLGIWDGLPPADMHFSLITTIPGGLPHFTPGPLRLTDAEGKKRIVLTTDYPAYSNLSVHTVKMMLNALLIILPCPVFKEQP